MPLRNVWASPAARDATKEERAAHAQCTTREEAVRLLQVMARSWGVEPEAAARVRRAQRLEIHGPTEPKGPYGPPGALQARGTAWNQSSSSHHDERSKLSQVSFFWPTSESILYDSD